MTQILNDLAKAGAEQVAAIKTTDGQLWDNAEVALAHQRKLNVKQELLNFADNYFYSGMSAHDAVEHILEHFDEIADIVDLHRDVGA